MIKQLFPIKKILFLFILFIVLSVTMKGFLPADAYQTQDYTFEVGIPGIVGKGESLPATGLNNFIIKIIKWLFPIAGLLGFVMIVYAGFEYAASGGNVNQQKNAQDRIVNAFIGLVLLFSFWIIIYTINPDILEPQNLDLPTSGTNDTNSNDKTTGPLVKIGDWYLRKELVDIIVKSPANSNLYKITNACETNKIPCQVYEEDPNKPSCHNQGYCVDIAPTTTIENEKKTEFHKLSLILCVAGLKVLYEDIDTTNAHLHISLPTENNTGFASYHAQKESCYYYRLSKLRILYVPQQCPLPPVQGASIVIPEKCCFAPSGDISCSPPPK